MRMIVTTMYRDSPGIMYSVTDDLRMGKLSSQKTIYPDNC